MYESRSACKSVTFRVFCLLTFRHILCLFVEQFRRLLLLAMIARIIVMPIQIWSDPIWYQFVGDTLPEMVFASAWSLLVTFFIQLVGVAIGVGTSTMPGIVIQATVSFRLLENGSSFSLNSPRLSFFRPTLSIWH